ncbi:MAG: helix-turn-helix domain-containing protein [Gemmatimonadaceae bacterium]
MSSLTLDWFQLVTAAGTLQGVVLAGVLFAQRSNRTANRLLAVLMLTFTVFLASSVYYSAGLFQRYPHFFGVAYPTPWLFGPLVYLYAVAASDRSWHLAPRHAIHFLPLAIILILTLPTFLMSGTEKIAMYDRIQRGNTPAIIAALDPLKFVSGIAYSVATLLYLRQHRRRIRDSYSNTERVSLGWLLWFSGTAAGIWLLATSLNIGAVASRLRDEHISLAIAVLIYAIGYRGLRQTEIFDYGSATDDAVVAELAVPQPELEASAPLYQRSGLTDREAKRLEQKLLDLMDRETPWKDAELTLADLARRLESTPHKLSEVLNGQLGQTFYDFVNGYRVREVQRRIAAGDGRMFTMLSLALDSGFASKSTFNQAFKNRTGQTPSAYRKAIAS